MNLDLNEMERRVDESLENETEESLTNWIIEQQVKDVINQMHDFHNSNIRNTWIRTNLIKIYIRKSKRFIEGNLIDFLDIATVDIYPQGQGVFTKLYDRILEEFNDNIFVESILNRRFLKFFTNRGFKMADEININVYKLR